MTHSPEPWAEDGLSRRSCQDFPASHPEKVSQDEYFVFDLQTKSTIESRVGALGLRVQPIGHSKKLDDTGDAMRTQLSGSNSRVEETLVTLPYGTFVASVSCAPIMRGEDCTDYAEVEFHLREPPLEKIFAQPVATPFDAVQVLPHLRRLHKQRQNGVLLAPPFAGQTKELKHYRDSLVKGRQWLRAALETAVRTGSSWQAGWTATLL